MKLEISEPALCCTTGVCGPEPCQQLIVQQNALHLLRRAGISVPPDAINQVPLALPETKP